MVKRPRNYRFLVTIYCLVIAIIAIMLVATFSAVGQQQNKATKLFNQGRYLDVIEAFGNQADDLGRYAIAASYLRLGLLYKDIYAHMLVLCKHYYELLFALETEIKETKHSKYTPYYLGSIYAQQGEYPKAIDQFKGILKRNDLDQEIRGYILIEQGYSYAKMNKLDEAEKSWEGAKSISRNNELISLELTYKHAILDKNDKDVSQIYQKLVNVIQPKTSDLSQLNRFNRNAGWICYRKGNLKLAKKYLDKVDASKPSLKDQVDTVKMLEFFDPIIFEYLSQLYFEEAISYFQTLVDKPKFKFDATYGMSLAQYHLGRFDQAISRLQGLDTSDSDMRQIAKVLLGACYYRLQKKSEAFSLWDSVEKKSSDSWIVRIELRVWRAELGVEGEKGIFTSTYHEALRRFSGGQALKQLKYYPPVQAFRRSEFFRRLGNAMFSFQKLDEAIEAYEVGRDQVHKNVIDEQGWGNDPALLLNIAFAYYKNGFNTYNQSTETYSLVHNIYPDVYPLHSVMQGIFVIEKNFHEDIRNKSTKNAKK